MNKCIFFLTLTLCLMGASVAQADCPIIPTAQRFSLNAAGDEVTDHQTGLVWARCSVGQSWDGSACTGTATFFTHEQALQQPPAASGWRLPSIKELASLADPWCDVPAIDTAAFPGTAGNQYWSASPVADDPTQAWTVNFLDGNVSYYARGLTYAVRLVRASQ